MSANWLRVLEKWENHLRVVLIMAFACLTATQSLLTPEPYRFYWSFADYLGGENMVVAGVNQAALKISRVVGQGN